MTREEMSCMRASSRAPLDTIVARTSDSVADVGHDRDAKPSSDRGPRSGWSDPAVIGASSPSRARFGHRLTGVRSTPFERGTYSTPSFTVQLGPRGSVTPVSRAGGMSASWIRRASSFAG